MTVLIRWRWRFDDERLSSVTSLALCGASQNGSEVPTSVVLVSSNHPPSRIRSTLREGITILRKEGVRSFVLAALRAANLNHRGFYYYAKYRLKSSRLRRHRTSDPFGIIWVDPSEVRRAAPELVNRWKHMGEVWSGDWDLESRPLQDLEKYHSVVEHFRDGVPWEETEIFRTAIEQIEAGGTYWNGCRTVSDIERRTRHIERLYESIRRDGFKSQSAIYGKQFKSRLLRGSFDRSTTEITVSIGRDGELLFVDGNHRLAIAHVLGVEEIPVQVVVRHERWQDIRDAVSEATSRSDLSAASRRYLDHPDIEPLRTYQLSDEQ